MNIKKMLPPVYFGTVFWSDFFNSHCVVVKYVNDKHWYFVVEDMPHKILKAQTNHKNVLKERKEKS